ncbi:MAG: hypothetical protein ACR2HH_06050 [Chthoniobacterales bacterium]
MKREDDQDLWDLLGKASTPAVSPFFARNVLRQIRREPDWRERLARWLQPKRLIPASGLALALVVASMSIHLPKKAVVAADDPPEAVANIDPQDYDVVADLDDLLASEDDNVWTEKESLSL